MKRLFVLLLFLCLGSLLCRGQSDTNFSTIQRVGFDDKIMHPSPEASQMLKYVDLPITHSLGTANISIPIFTIEGKETNIPISLSYHPSGIKVYEQAGSVGLGWTLHAGGVVGKEVRGIPDDFAFNQPWFKADELIQHYPTNGRYMATEGALVYLHKVVKNNQDSFRDVYKYAYPGGGFGSFICVKGVPIKLISNDDIITTSMNDGRIVEFRIKDPNGNQYFFTQQEDVKGYTRPRRDWAVGDATSNQGAEHKTGSSWYISKMLSANNLDEFIFEYDTLISKYTSIRKIQNLIYKRRSPQKEYTTGANWSPDKQYLVRCILDPYFVSEQISESQVFRDYINRKVLKSISYNSGSDGYNKVKVNFEYGQNSDQQGSLRLDVISVVNSGGDEIKRVRLNQTNFRDSRRKLDLVSFIGTDGKVYDSYSFSYYDAFSECPEFSQDQFGYQNGSIYKRLLFKYLFDKDVEITDVLVGGDNSMAEDQPKPYTENWEKKYNNHITTVNHLLFVNPKENNGGMVDSGNGETTWPDGSSGTWETRNDEYDIPHKYKHTRDYSFEHARRYSLCSIERMSGAKTVFKYGAPEWDYKDWDTKEAKIASTGIRIDSILTYDRGDKLVKLRTFEYTNSGCTIDLNSLGITDYMSLDQHSVHIITKNGFAYNTIESQSIILSSSPVLPGMNPDLARVFYRNITETISNGTPNDPDKVMIEYTYDCDASIHHPIYVRQITNGSTPKTWIDQILIPKRVTGFAYHKQENPDTTVYFEPIERIKRYFAESPPSFNNISSKVTYKFDKNGGKQMLQKDTTVYVKVCNVEKADSGGAITVGLYAERLTACMSIEPHEGQDGNIIGSVTQPGDPIQLKDLPEDCFYFDVFQYVHTTRPLYTKTIFYNNSGTHEQKRVYKYDDPKQYNAWPFSGSTLAEANVDWRLLESLVSSENPIQLKTLQLRGSVSFIGEDTYYKRYLYPDNYNNADLCNTKMPAYTPLGEETIKNGKNISATYTKYDFVKCEGKLDFTAQKMIKKPVKKVNVLNGKTTAESNILEYDYYGNPAYVIQTGEPATCYIWGYGGIYPVAVIRNASYADVKAALGTETLKRITRAATLSNADLVLLDKLRDSSSLREAQITISTYKPLVGVTSMTDPSGRKLYYYYDAAGRLTAIKDEQYNFVETYEYKNIN